MKLFECVPNVSEGRDEAILGACVAAIESAGAKLADRESDSVHHRSVFTFFGDRATVVNAAVALAEVTTAQIDLRAHRGAHPRIGALDVLPFVPLDSATMPDAVAVAREAAQRIWEAVRVPSIFYGAAATDEKRRVLADVRAGEFEGLVAGPPRRAARRRRHRDPSQRRCDRRRSARFLDRVQREFADWRCRPGALDRADLARTRRRIADLARPRPATRRRARSNLVQRDRCRGHAVAPHRRARPRAGGPGRRRRRSMRADRPRPARGARRRRRA